MHSGEPLETGPAHSKSNNSAPAKVLKPDNVSNHFIASNSVTTSSTITTSTHHQPSHPVLNRIREATAFDRIINSPSTEFDSLSAEGLFGLTDYKEDSLYPGELDEDCLHENHYSSASGTPLSLRRRQISENSASETPPERRKLDLEESRDVLTALPPPPPPILEEERQRKPPPKPPRHQPPLPPAPLKSQEVRVVSTSPTGPPPSNFAEVHKKQDPNLCNILLSQSSTHQRKQLMAQLAEEELAQNEVMETSEGNLRNVFNAPSCQMKSVTVYLDRAEVCRVVRPRVMAGESEVILRKLSPAIEKDTIRVEVKGPATIADVTYSATHNKEEESEKVKLREATSEKIISEQRRLEALGQKQQRLLKQRDVLNSFADTLIKKPDSAATPGAPDVAKETAPTSIGGHNVVDAFDPKHMQTLSSFLDLYERQAARLDDDLIQVRVDIQKKEERIRELEKELRDIESRFAEILSREVSIVLDSQETTQLELYVSYVVTRAKWSPKYDIRVFSNESVMKIIYYGLVNQNTGEDWESAQISLSTSQPGTGGTVPILGLHKAHFKSNKTEQIVTLRRNKPRKTKRVVKALSFHANDKMASNLARLTAEDGFPTSSDGDELDIKSPVEGTPAHTAVNGLDASLEVVNEEAVVLNEKLRSLHDSLRLEPNVATAHFDVPRLFSIPSDSEEHKVTIAIIDLTPTFEFETVPQKAQFAYLKAVVTNTSPYPLLAGPTNIYVDNNFIAKSDLKAAAPLEEFSCHLGADHGIKVIYKPMFKKKESGPGKVVTYSHKQVIELRNNHQKPIKILVMESVPLATEEKIKVNLIEPSIKQSVKYDSSKPIRMNKSNCIEWDVELGPGENKELSLRYNIDHPPNETLDYTVSEA